MIQILVALSFFHVQLPPISHDEGGTYKVKIKDPVACEAHECDSCQVSDNTDRCLTCH